MNSEPWKSKWLAKGNLEEMPLISDSNYNEGTTLQLSLWVCLCVYPHILYFFSPNKHLTCFTTFHLCGNSFSANLQSQGLVTDCWSKWLGFSALTHWYPILSLWPGTEALLQAPANQGHPRSVSANILASIHSYSFSSMQRVWDPGCYSGALAKSPHPNEGRKECRKKRQLHFLQIKWQNTWIE